MAIVARALARNTAFALASGVRAMSSGIRYTKDHEWVKVRSSRGASRRPPSPEPGVTKRPRLPGEGGLPGCSSGRRQNRRGEEGRRVA